MKILSIITLAFCLTSMSCFACVHMSPDGETYTIDSSGSVDYKIDKK